MEAKAIDRIRRDSPFSLNQAVSERTQASSQARSHCSSGRNLDASWTQEPPLVILDNRRSLAAAEGVVAPTVAAIIGDAAAA
jgi:hypothetical protein